MNITKVCYIWDEDLIKQSDRLPAVPGRASLVHNLITAYNLIENVKVVRSSPASYNDLKEFHSELYLDHLKTFTEIDEEYMSNAQDEEYGIGYDCPPVSNMFELVSTIAGGSITAARCLVLGLADVAINWCGGWHHAHRFGADGFCYVNDIVLAIEKLRPKFPKVLYIDLDILNLQGDDFSIPFESDALLAWAATCPGVEPPAKPELQRAWDDLRSKFILSELIESHSGTDLARIKAATCPESGAWLQALPSPQLGTHLDNDSLRVAVALRLGCRICEPHICPCGAAVDASGHHGLSCAKCAGRFPRHHALNDIIRRALVSANIPCTLEPPGLCRSDGKRPDGLSLVPWEKGRSLLWDATCVSTYAASHLPRTTREAGSAAEYAAAQKHVKYSELTRNYIFVPFAVETGGPWAKEAKKFARELGRRLRDRGCDPRSGAYLIQHISLAIQRGNAAGIMGTFEPGNGVQDAYNLSNSVFTLSFHKYEPGFYPGSGNAEDIGTLSGTGYSANVPLQASYSDATLEYVFEKVFEKVFSLFCPEAMVVQCGADALARDPHGGAGLTLRGYCSCVQRVLDKRKPTILLGGGGYKHPNAARLWTSLTALVTGVELDENIPEHEDWTSYGPDYMLPVQPTLARDANKKSYLDNCLATIIGNLEKYLVNEDTEINESKRRKTDLQNVDRENGTENELDDTKPKINEHKAEDMPSKCTKTNVIDIYDFTED
ncbi:histone deacetylase domain-containing protein [Phthorimaea operculella]|nr:histone deacetylase domain-containing protein [Phthorimaea operculella]